MRTTLVAAVDEGMGIGRDGIMPWYAPDDLRHFKNLTVGSTVLMGRKTAESIGRPLLGRVNIVLTRGGVLKDPERWRGVHLANTLKAAYAFAESVDTQGEVYVIGGADVYRQTIEKAHRMILTHIPQRHGCTEFFPLPGEAWKKVNSSLTPAGLKVDTFLNIDVVSLGDVAGYGLLGSFGVVSQTQPRKPNLGDLLNQHLECTYDTQGKCTNCGGTKP
jgi:dihydrofolate reductase